MHALPRDLRTRNLRIAYTIQNVGGIDFSLDLGDTVPVKYTLSGLRRAGHEICCLKLAGREVLAIDNIDQLENARSVSLGITGSQPFRFSERGLRYLQRKMKLPYFAAFDSVRFYDSCRRHLPGYHLCHEHNGLFSMGTALACTQMGLPYVLTVSAEPLFEMKLTGKSLSGLHAKIAAWEAGYTYRSANKIITVSAPAKQDLVNNWQVDPEKIVVMPNGVDIERFAINVDTRSLRNTFKLGDGPVVCFVGWFQIWHGIDFLIDSFAQVLAQIPSARLLLVGDGDARSQVEQKIAEHQIGSAVTITGLVDRTQVPGLLAMADVAVLPYPKLPKEMWFSPLKLYEYMAAGKAIVGSKSGQIAQVIQHNHNGILVEPGDVIGFADAIINLLRNPIERTELGCNAHKQAVEQHSWQHYIAHLEDIYHSVL